MRLVTVQMPLPSSASMGVPLPTDTRLASVESVGPTNGAGIRMPCLVPVFLDGMKILSDEMEVQPRLEVTCVPQLGGMEVYRNQREVPAAYPSNHAFCGLVRRWTK